MSGGSHCFIARAELREKWEKRNMRKQWQKKQRERLSEDLKSVFHRFFVALWHETSSMQFVDMPLSVFTKTSCGDSLGD